MYDNDYNCLIDKPAQIKIDAGLLSRICERLGCFDENRDLVDRNAPSVMNSFSWHMKEYLSPTFLPFEPSKLNDVLFFTLYWWRKAAEQGVAEAQYQLAEAYSNGQGILKNMEKAYYWWLKAAENGHENARKILDKVDISYNN
jgi:hypothetical protein